MEGQPKSGPGQPVLVEVEGPPEETEEKTEGDAESLSSFLTRQGLGKYADVFPAGTTLGDLRAMTEDDLQFDNEAVSVATQSSKVRRESREKPCAASDGPVQLVTDSSSNLPSPTSLELPHLSSVPVLTGPTSGATVKTERGEHVTTGNRTRVVRLAVTNANHYTKRSHDHLAWKIALHRNFASHVVYQWSVTDQVPHAPWDWPRQ
ncbi:hypothetical protein Bbelb_123440 [Branchiostoma belcheri]|nr:hypothetical protein Bbelb_123440 [Branchiostoma belcheri]